ncbi:hypothetical protein [Kangiella sp. TOML190]|uniref:hypothetical protein n=1 Tax=Kangiella sp. TOML190 TaxID=2931351 RepID=UPI00203ECA6B|nr:hypothetical protein [Kangiella sp. TOML190]
MLKTVDMAQGLPPCVYSNVELDNRAVSEVIDYYSLVFSEHEAGQKYLSKRGIKDIELISRLQIGFCDRSLGHQLQQLTFMEEQAKRGALQRVGLLKSSGHEFLRGALVFPFFNEDGKVISAYGRRITPKLRSGSYYFLHWYKHQEAVFFNHEALSKQNEIILCKNPIEALIWLSHGFDNAIGLMGCQSYCSQHVDMLKYNGVSKVLIAYGTSREELVYARKANLLNIKAGLETRMLVLPDAMDASGYAMSVDNPIKGLTKAYMQPYILD